MRDSSERNHNSLNDTTEMASPRATPAEKNATEKVAGPVGGASGALVGGTVGTLVAGPIGTAIGALAGAVGGWWATRGVADAVPTEQDEKHYEQHYTNARAAVGVPAREANIMPRSFDHARPAYQLGHLAARNPAYAGKRFEEIEDDLMKAWSNDLRDSHGEWASVRGYAQEAYGQRPRGQR
jgi:hypothetical protein